MALREGYRFFAVDRDGDVPLVGPYHSSPWPDRIGLALTCLRGGQAHVGTPDHMPPMPGCRCGLAVMDTLPDLVARLTQYNLFVDRLYTHLAASRLATARAAGATFLADLIAGQGFRAQHDIRAVPAIGRVIGPEDWLPDPCCRYGVWRTRWARLEELWLPSTLADQADRLSAHYEVPVHVATTSGLDWLDELAPAADHERQGCAMCTDPTYPVCEASWAELMDDEQQHAVAMLTEACSAGRPVPDHFDTRELPTAKYTRGRLPWVGPPIDEATGRPAMTYASTFNGQPAALSLRVGVEA